MLGVNSPGFIKDDSGFIGKLKGDYKINDKLFTGLKKGYIYGKDRVEDVDINWMNLK